MADEVLAATVAHARDTIAQETVSMLLGLGIASGAWTAAQASDALATFADRLMERAGNGEGHAITLMASALRAREHATALAEQSLRHNRGSGTPKDGP